MEPSVELIPEVFILWHPQCKLGAILAPKILDWLRPGNGLGPDVFYRCLPAPEAPPNGLPPPLPGEMRSGPVASVEGKRRFSNLQVVLPLIDEHMVADQTWRYWLDRLPRTTQQRLELIPVALDATAYNMPPSVRALNYLRPAGVPLADPSGPELVGVVRSLLRQITEALCRLVLPSQSRRQSPDQSSPAADQSVKVNVFLSHAKQDGQIPARRLRDYIYSQTQLTAFYDENDIALGAMFDQIINRSLESADTAALIAVRSARYAARPWCRRELSIFRRPRPDGVTASGAERWRLHPTLVVEAMEGSQLSAGIAEFGNSPLIRWRDDDPDLEELIVTTVIRNAMLASFHATLGASLPSHANQIVVNWLPDPTTLLHIPVVGTRADIDILYPGCGLCGIDLDILAEFFPALTFRSFEEVVSQ